MPRPVRFPPKSFSSPSCPFSHYPHTGDDVGGYGVLSGVVRDGRSVHVVVLRLLKSGLKMLEGVDVASVVLSDTWCISCRFGDSS